jgi:membrane protein required for colicin V production
MNDLPLNSLDMGVGLVLLASAFLAYMRGFVHEALSVGAWVGAIFASIYAFPFLKSYTRTLIPFDLAADITTGVVAFFVTLVFLSMLTRSISRRIQDSAFNILDRSLGFLFGVLRGGVLICLLYIAMEWVAPPAEQPQWVRTARTIKLIETGASLLASLVPKAAASGAAAVQDAEQKLLDMQEAEKALRGILSTKPEDTPPTLQEGYKRKERRDMERLIESNQ